MSPADRGPADDGCVTAWDPVVWLLDYVRVSWIYRVIEQRMIGIEIAGQSKRYGS